MRAVGILILAFLSLVSAPAIAQNRDAGAPGGHATGHWTGGDAPGF